MPTSKAVFLGRFSPFHLGHEAVIRQMLKEYAPEDCLIVIGSTNVNDQRTPFSLIERRKWLQELFPDLPIVNLHDFPTDSEWLHELKEVLQAHGIELTDVTFWGGSKADLSWFIEAHFPVRVVDRFSGVTPIISATQVREALHQKTSLAGLVNPRLEEQIKQAYTIVTR